MVGELRESTGAGLMDCKKALVESEGDFDSAVDLLRKRGVKIHSFLFRLHGKIENLIDTFKRAHR
jgi:hypothetical protein